MECTCNSSSQIAVIDHCPSGLYGIGCTTSMLLILNEYAILLRCCHILCVCVYARCISWHCVLNILLLPLSSVVTYSFCFSLSTRSLGQGVL